jgi:two-component system capsular synthesis response regulator RcsB
MNSSMTSVVLADNHSVVLEGARHHLEKNPTISVIGTANNSTALITKLDQLLCDVLVSDYVMPGEGRGDGLALFSFIRRRHPNLKVVVLSTIENPTVVRSLLDMSILCIVSKADPVDHLTPAVQAACANNGYLSPRMMRISASITPDTRSNSSCSSLTKRELEVVRFFSSGMSVTEISMRLHRSVKTISTQKMTAMLKLGISGNAELMLYGLQSGLAFSATRPNF